MDNCVFCDIINEGVNRNFLYEDERVVAFRDINPQAPFHILIIPRQHYISIKEVYQEELIGHLFTVGNRLAEELGVDSFRYVINTGREAGQSVFHLHLHLLGGRHLGWPPG